MRVSLPGRTGLLLAITVGAACGGASRQEEPPPPRPSIVLITLDTTRADAIGQEARGIETPAFNALAARGLRFRQAYATAPETLPSHASMMTGLYPGGHGIHENGRVLSSTHAVLAERLRAHGYRTAAFVSSFVLARRFGLARGFDVYDDATPAGQSERAARDTTDRAIEHLRSAPGPWFVWVHYFDPHAPYVPPEPWRSRYAAKPYLGEIAAMDEQLGRLVSEVEKKAPAAIVVAADHGEGLGDHGEPQHGSLLYQSTMHVPLAIVGPGVTARVVEEPVSTRHVFHTVLDLAGLGEVESLRAPKGALVLGEAMKPFLSYGWRPQVMAVEGSRKTILAGRMETYDVAADPGETRELGDVASRAVRDALRGYPVPSLGASAAPLGDEERRQLASLGYVSAGAAPVLRPDAPRPADRAHLLEPLERASGLFVAAEYAKAVPLLERILREDPHNLDALLRLATAHSFLRHEAQALAAFERARQLAPESPDVRAYLALHYARGREWRRALPMLEQVLEQSPDRLPALEALATLREREGRADDALVTLHRIAALRAPSPDELLRTGRLAMSLERTSAAIEAFEAARAAQGPGFAHDLELGVLFLAARRYLDARDALDRVPPTHPDRAMVLFKRAQVSVLLGEPDRQQRIEAARAHADPTTKELIAKERLFRSPP